MLKDSDVKIGQHCWALSNCKLLIVLKAEAGGYDVCGAWECGIGADEIEIISVIDKPEGFDSTQLYYL